MADPDKTLANEGDGEPEVQDAVQQFVSRHTQGSTPDLDVFCSRFPSEIRAEIQKQCELFLDFEGVVGQSGSERLKKPHASGDEEKSAMRLGDFAIEEELGRGGMGVVYLASQISLRRKVALKILPAGLSLSTRHVEWFRREASSAARLRHPGIVPIYAFGEVGGTNYFAMEYVPGKDLGDTIDELRSSQPKGERKRITGRLGTGRGASYGAEVAEVVARIAGALACAHEAGIVHRDLKPRNIIMDQQGKPRLLDFGLAKDIGTESLSVPGELAGTPHYMSPEQTLAKRAPLDHRTDIFSMGVILYELLTLELPFDGKNLQQIVYEICFAEPKPIHKLNTQAPRDLAIICLKAMEKAPAARYATAAAMEEDLQRFLRHEPIQARPAGKVTRAVKWARRHRSLTIGAAAAVLASVGLFGWNWYQDLRAGRMTRELLDEAEVAKTEGRYEDMAALALSALTFAPDDDAVKAQVSDYQLVQVQEQRDRAEANRLFTESANVLSQDKDLALILALEGAEKQTGPMARRAVLAALEARYQNVSLIGDESQVQRMDLSPDGSRVVTGSVDNTARLWDARDGSLLGVLDGHEHWVADVQFSPDGKRVVTASYDSTARVWDAATAALITELRGHERQLHAASFSPDGQRVVTTSEDADARIWDATTGECLWVLEGHVARVVAAEFSPDGGTVATAAARSIDNPAGLTSQLWDAHTGVALQSLVHGILVLDLQFSPDGSRLATACGDGSARIFSVPEGRLMQTLRHSDDVRSVRFSPDGTQLLTASYDRTARLWDVETGGELMVLLHDNQVRHAGFSADGALLVTASDDHAVRVFDAATADEIHKLDHDYPVYDADFYPDSEKVVTLAPNRTRSVRIWDLEEGRHVIPLRHGENVYSAWFDPARARVLTGSLDETARVWSAANGRLLLTIREGVVYFTDFDPFGDRIVTAGEKDAHIWDGGSGELLQSLEGHTAPINSAFFSEDGRWVVTASRDKSARVWNSNTGSIRQEFQRPNAVRFASLSPDGERLVTVEDEEPVARVWQVATGEELFVLSGHEDRLTSAVFHPDGSAILTASRDNTARLWDAGDGTALRVFEGHEDGVNSAAFSSAGDRIVTASQDRTARLWDAANGDALLIFAGHGSGVRWAALSPDGKRAISGSVDNTARIWPTNPLELARSMELRNLTRAERERFSLPLETDR